MPDETPRPDSSFGDGETPRVGPPPTIRGLADDTLRDAPLAVPRPGPVQQPAGQPVLPSSPTPIPRQAQAPPVEAPLQGDPPDAPAAGGYGTLGAGAAPPAAAGQPPIVPNSPLNPPGSTVPCSTAHAAGDATLRNDDPATRAYHEAALAAAQAAQSGTPFGKYDLLEPIAKGAWVSSIRPGSAA